MRRMTQHLVLVAVASFGVFLAGCGPGGDRRPETGATLEGTVTYGKDKVEVAMVIAQGEGSSATGFISDDGRYKIENVPLGQVNLAVNTAAGKGQMMSKVMARSQSQTTAPMPKVIDVPDKYADPSASGITTTVKKGQNTFDIVIPK
jgi:hypothetical protein